MRQLWANAAAREGKIPISGRPRNFRRKFKLHASKGKRRYRAGQQVEGTKLRFRGSDVSGRVGNLRWTTELSPLTRLAETAILTPRCQQFVPPLENNNADNRVTRCNSTVTRSLYASRACVCVCV